MSEQCKYCKVRGLKEFISKKNGKPYFRWVGDSEIHTYEECRSIQSKATTWVEVINKHNSAVAAGLTKNNNGTQQASLQVQRPIQTQTQTPRLETTQTARMQEPTQDMGILLNTIYDIVREIQKQQKTDGILLDGIGQKMQLLIEKVGYPAPELVITESEQKVIDDVKPKQEQEQEEQEQEQKQKDSDIHKTLLAVINGLGSVTKQKLYTMTEGPFTTKEDIDGALDWLLFNSKIGIIENDEQDDASIYTKIHEPVQAQTQIKEEPKKREIIYQDIDVSSWKPSVTDITANCDDCNNIKSSGFVNTENELFICEGCFLKHYTHDDFKKIKGIDEKPLSEYEKDTEARTRTLEQINEIDSEYSF